MKSRTPMSTARIALAVYAVFLAGYAFSKLGGEAGQLGFQSSIVLVLTTAVAPYLAALVAARLLGGRPVVAGLAAALVGVLVCVGGYGAHWWYFLAPEGGAPALYHVAPQGAGWGLLQGALAAIVAYRPR